MYETLREPIHAIEKQSYREKIHLIGDKREDGTISIHYVPTDKLAVDPFTKKSVSVSKMETFSFDERRHYAISTSLSEVSEFRSNDSLKLRKIREFILT